MPHPVTVIVDVRSFRVPRRVAEPAIALLLRLLTPLLLLLLWHLRLRLLTPFLLLWHLLLLLSWWTLIQLG